MYILYIINLLEYMNLSLWQFIYSFIKLYVDFIVFILIYFIFSYKANIMGFSFQARLQAEADEGPSDSEIPGLDAAISLDSSSQPEDKPEEIVIDDDDEDNAQVKNAESEVSVEKEENESEQVTPPPPEEEEDDDDDVIINEVVPEKIILDDDDGNDEEYVPSAIVPKPVNIIVKQEPIDDGFVDVGEGILKFDNITIKTEPLDTGNLFLKPFYSSSNEYKII